MPNYATMQQRIADELARDDLSEIIRQAILDAIQYYQYELTFANRVDAAGVLEAGTHRLDLSELATSSPILEGREIITVDSLWLLDNNRLWTMLEQSWPEVIGKTGTLPVPEGIPSMYAVVNNDCRFDRKAVADITLRVLVRATIPAPQLDIDGEPSSSPAYAGLDDDVIALRSASAFWMTTAERCVRTYAKGCIYSDALRDAEAAAAEFVQSQLSYEKLQQRTVESQMPDSLAPWGGDEIPYAVMSRAGGW